MTKIEQLQNELNESLNAQQVLHEKLKNCLTTLREIERLLNIVSTRLKYSNHYIHTLEQENGKLKSSCEAWIKRSIKLEFEVLSARDSARK